MKTHSKTKKNAGEEAVQRAAPRGYPVYRPTVSTILACACGMKYIKTRDPQTTCLKCLVKAEDAKGER